ncbi:MAG: hypothetical protein ABIH99_04865 [Candidatus Micrarchaeota archaeon]
MNKLNILLAILLISSFAFAYWTENVELHVVDGNGRAIPNAFVEVKYQTDKYPLKEGEFDARGTGYTNEYGMFNITLYNQVPADKDKEEYVLFVTYWGITKPYTGRHWDGKPQPAVIEISLPIYQLLVSVNNQHGKPVKGARVSVQSSVSTVSAISSSLGYATFSLPEGTYTVQVEDGDSVNSSTTILSANDSSVSLITQEYDLVVSVVDEEGNPLSAAITVAGKSALTNDSGEAVFPTLPGKSTLVSVSYNELIKSTTADLFEGAYERVVLDLSAPQIGELTVKGSRNELLMLQFNIIDNGKYSSGISSVKFQYAAKKNESDTLNWTAQSLYLINSTTFQTTIPAQEDGTELFYLIEAEDGAGNLNSISGNYTINYAQIKKDSEPIFSFGNFNWFPVIAVIVLLGVLFFIYKKYSEGY